MKQKDTLKLDRFSLNAINAKKGFKSEKTNPFSSWTQDFCARWIIDRFVSPKSLVS